MAKHPEPTTKPDSEPAPKRRTVNWSAVTSFITALTAIGALIFTGLSLNATRDQVDVAREDQRVALQGQFTDRYSRAIDQLGEQGPDRLQIRLGGIYALERLARDSPRDQATIIEVLSTFVRTNTSRTVIKSPKKGMIPTHSCPDNSQRGTHCRCNRRGYSSWSPQRHP
jgi:hypothetical protein